GIEGASGRGAETLGAVAGGAAALEVDGEDGDVGGGDAADAQGLAEAAGGELRQFLPRLVAQAVYRGIVEADRDELVFELGEARDVSRLARDVPRVLDPHLDPPGDVAADGAEGGVGAGEGVPGDVGAAQELERRGAGAVVDAHSRQRGPRRLGGGYDRLEPIPPLVPLIWPARNSPGTFLVSSVERICVGHTMSYSTA